MNRRQFLKSSALAAAALSLPYSLFEWGCSEKPKGKQVFLFQQTFASPNAGREAIQTFVDQPLSIADYWITHLYNLGSPDKRLKQDYGSLEDIDLVPKVSSSTLDFLVDKTRAAHKKMLPMIYANDLNGELALILDAPEKSAGLVAKRIQGMSADGVAIDFEGLSRDEGNTYQERFVEFMAALRSALPKGDYHIAVAVGALFPDSDDHFANHTFYDYAGLSEHADSVQIMCYNFNYRHPGPSMPESLLRKVLSYAKDHIAQEKIVPTFATYDSRWRIRWHRHHFHTISKRRTYTKSPEHQRFLKHEHILKYTQDDGELHILTDRHQIYAQDPKGTEERLSLLDREHITNVGFWKHTEGLSPIYQAVKAWKEAP